VNEWNFLMRVWELPTVACLESVGGDKFMYQFEGSKKKRSVETQTNMPNKVQFNWYTLRGHLLKSWVSCLIYITLLMVGGPQQVP